MQYVRVIVFSPPAFEKKIKKALWDAGAGKYGNYKQYSFTSEGISTWTPLLAARPARGNQDVLTVSKEKRIETVCPEDKIQDVLTAIKKVHPYEMPAIEIYTMHQATFLQEK